MHPLDGGWGVCVGPRLGDLRHRDGPRIGVLCRARRSVPEVYSREGRPSGASSRSPMPRSWVAVGPDAGHGHAPTAHHLDALGRLRHRRDAADGGLEPGAVAAGAPGGGDAVGDDAQGDRGGHDRGDERDAWQRLVHDEHGEDDGGQATRPEPADEGDGRSAEARADERDGDRHHAHDGQGQDGEDEDGQRERAPAAGRAAGRRRPGSWP